MGKFSRKKTFFFQINQTKSVNAQSCVEFYSDSNFIKENQNFPVKIRIFLSYNIFQNFSKNLIFQRNSKICKSCVNFILIENNPYFHRKISKKYKNNKSDTTSLFPESYIFPNLSPLVLSSNVQQQYHHDQSPICILRNIPSGFGIMESLTNSLPEGNASWLGSKASNKSCSQVHGLRATSPRGSPPNCEKMGGGGKLNSASGT